MAYTFPFLTAFFLAIVGCFLLITLRESFVFHQVFRSRQLDDLSSCSDNKKRGVLFRFGGGAVVLSFLLAIFFDPNLLITADHWGLIFGALCILAFGVLDDIFTFHWSVQLAFQFFLSVFVVLGFGVVIDPASVEWIGGLVVDNMFWSILAVVATIVWFLMLINALNWNDGVDGLSGGVVAISALTLFFLSLKPEVNQPPAAILALSVLGAVVGFLTFNFSPARIILGTAGAYFCGFFLAYFAVFAGTKLATALLVLAIPLIDAGWVIFWRILQKRSPFTGDDQHLHYRLRNVGWSDRQIALFYWSATAILGMVALFTRELGKGLAILVSVGVIGCFLVFVHRIFKTYGEEEKK